jgi:hypothetical protein
MADVNVGARRAATALTIFAALALLVSLFAVPAASGTGGATAVIAKKKCKKGFKKVTVKGKTKCKKQKTKPPVVVILPKPLVRGTLAWNAAAEVDLHAYDSSGNHSGWVEVPTPGVVQGIPNATHSPDANGTTTGKTESFTDNIFLQGGTTNREFTYVACFYDAANTGSFIGVASNGQSTTIPITTDPISSGSYQAFVFQVTGGPAPPVNSPC